VDGIREWSHPEERATPVSRRTHIAFSLILTVAFFACSCSSENVARYPAVRQPLGQRQALHPGLWRGQVGMTLIDFRIDQVLPAAVAVRVSGTVLRLANQPKPASALDTYFYDRPRTCKLTADGRSFDCTRYVDMHIDNGLLCGVYQAPNEALRPCLQPVP